MQRIAFEAFAFSVTNEQCCSAVCQRLVATAAQERVWRRGEEGGEHRAVAQQGTGARVGTVPGIGRAKGDGKLKCYKIVKLMLLWKVLPMHIYGLWMDLAVLHSLWWPLCERNKAGSRIKLGRFVSNVCPQLVVVQTAKTNLIENFVFKVTFCCYCNTPYHNECWNASWMDCL